MSMLPTSAGQGYHTPRTASSSCGLELTGDDVEVCGVTVQLALLCALHSCNRELVPPGRQQVTHCVGHQLPIGDVAALGALAGGHIDDIGLQGDTRSGGVPDHVGRGGCDSRGRQVCWRQRP